MDEMCNIKILDRRGPLQVRKEKYDYEGVAVYCLLDDETVISAGDDYRIRIWNWYTGVEEKVLFGKNHHAIQCMALSHSKKLLVTGHASWGGVHVWDIATGKLFWFVEDLLYIESVAFNQDDTLVLVHKYGDEVKKYHTETGELMGAIGHDFDGALPSCFSPDGATIYFLDRKSIKSVCTNTGMVNWCVSMERQDGRFDKAISPDGSMLCFLDADLNVRILRAKDGAIGPILATSDYAENEYDDLRVRILPDSRHVVVYVEETDALQIWNIAAGRLVCETTMEDDVYIVQDIAVFSDNKRFVAGDRLGTQFLGTLENLSKSDVEVVWELQEQSEFLKFSGRFGLYKSGYCWYSEAFVERISEAQFPEIIDYANLLMESSSRDDALTVVLLKEILEALQKRDDAQDITIDVLLNLLMQSTLSAGAALHDPNGELTTYAEQSAKKLNNIGVERFSDAQRQKLLDMYEQVMHFADQLQQINIEIILPDKSLLKG
ncbi:MAG: hypothetical protein OEZ39_03875 [Gammaproteobacteria bacterium]|nr:hypothetical protein [Gammaproteobacteria bacterium]